LALLVGVMLNAVAASVPAEHAAVMDRLVRDDLGREVRLGAPPRRIVSVLPSITETVCALDACDRLVATDRFSNWPAQVRTLPKVADLDDLDFERLVRLRPDLVLLSRSQRVSDRLEQLGIVNASLDTDSYASIDRNIARVGEMLHARVQAQRLIERIDREIERIGAAAQAREQGHPPSVYFEVDSTPYAASAESFIGELLRRLGARNIVEGGLGPFPKLNPEYVVRRDPDIIMLGDDEHARLEERPGWMHLRALRADHVCRFDKSERDTIVRPGPRVPQGMATLAACLARWSS